MGAYFCCYHNLLHTYIVCNKSRYFVVGRNINFFCSVCRNFNLNQVYSSQSMHVFHTYKIYHVVANKNWTLRWELSYLHPDWIPWNMEAMYEKCVAYNLLASFSSVIVDKYQITCRSHTITMNEHYAHRMNFILLFHCLTMNWISSVHLWWRFDTENSVIKQKVVSLTVK